MKTRFLSLGLLLLLLALPLAACGEIPTPGGAYPPPQTPLAGASPAPDGTRPPLLDGRAVCVDRPLYKGPCTPTPDASERMAVQYLDLPATIDFDVQRAIYTAQQQGTPGQLAAVYIHFDPGILTITATAALARQHGMQVEYQMRSWVPPPSGRRGSHSTEQGWQTRFAP
jgi:hypothetical protein